MLRAPRLRRNFDPGPPRPARQTGSHGGRRRPPFDARCTIAAPMSEPLHPVQIEGFRRMTPAEKLQMVADLYEAGIQLRVAGLRMAHPDWPQERLEFEARRSLLYAGT